MNKAATKSIAKKLKKKQQKTTRLRINLYTFIKWSLDKFEQS